MREKLIVGNWKMYKTVKEAVEFVQGLLNAKFQNQIYLAVPYTAIQETATLAKGSSVVIGAQNMNDAEEGAYTGEIAGLMLKEVGAEFVLLGHSERRKYFKETDQLIHRKVLRALEDGLLPILCVGESLEEKEAGKTEEILKNQLEKGLQGVDSSKKFIIAYEPLWAIGSGRTATPEIANSIQGFIRKCLAGLFSEEVAANTSILYGGSVTEQNVANLVQQEEVDGVLVGGASLSLESFIKIIQNSSEN